MDALYGRSKVQLTKNFYLSEMVRSQTAARRGIANKPGTREIAALKLLCQKVLQPVRDHYAVPVNVSSGYRSPRLNQAIGGSHRSQHCRGQAADFTVAGHSNIEVCQWLERRLNYDQLIYEYGEAGWIHCSYRRNYRNQELSALRRGGRTIYLAGLVAPAIGPQWA